MLALVTGATGLVGSHVVERLVAEGWQVRALVREPGAAEWLAERGAELRGGDVLDAESVARAAAGCDVVHHAAAVVTSSGGWGAYRRSNVDGTRNVVAAAARAGARLVHVSSVAVYGRPAHGTPGIGGAAPLDEGAPLAPLPERAYYARSKRESEALVLDAHRAGHLWATAIRPAVIYGRRDRQFVPRVGRLLKLGAIPLPAGGRSAIAVVHAANVADAAVRAAATPAAGGHVYNVGHDFDLTVAGFFRLAGAGLGRRLALVPVPVAAARAGLASVRAVVAVVAAVRGAPPRALPGATIDFLTGGNPYVSERARRELGWRPSVAPEQGVPDAFRWWSENIKTTHTHP